MKQLSNEKDLFNQDPEKKEDEMKKLEKQIEKASQERIKKLAEMSKQLKYLPGGSFHKN